MLLPLKKLIIGSIVTSIPSPVVASSIYFSNTQAEFLETLLIASPAKQVNLQLPKIRRKLNDYTFRLVSQAGWGTGWILDYQLPKKGEKYPLTWYIATNHHVIDQNTFKDNSYEIKDFCSLTACKSNTFSDLSFIRRNMKGKEYLYDGAVKRNKMKPPKLFFVADNFLENTEIKQYRDFAVLEIEFSDEEYAREVTANFAIKYPVGTKKAINIFAPSLSEEEIKEQKGDYYNLSYPQRAGRWNYWASWFDKQENASKVLGIANVKIAKCANHGTCDKDKGYSYKVLNAKIIDGGASGSLYIDDKANLLGLLTSSFKSISQKGNGVVPLRSKKISIGNVSSPEYDLILGTKGQTISYKSQVEKYLMREKGVKTWLSTFKEWNATAIA